LRSQSVKVGRHCHVIAAAFFKLIEFWLENRSMLEVMNNHEWERYKKLDRAVGKPTQNSHL